MSKTVIITKGIPASGKSTWAKEQIDKNPGMYKRVNKDDLREMLDNSNWSDSNEKFILKLRDQIIIEGLKAGKHVICDDTNLDPKHETRIREIVSEYNKTKNDSVQVVIVNFNISVTEAIKRDSKRSKPVGAKVIRDMYNKYLKIEPKQLDQDELLPKAIIVDIDGTVAIRGDRSSFDWKHVGEDKPNEPIVKLVKILEGYGFIVLFISGRDAICRNETNEWIKKIFPGAFKYELFMRNIDDNRKDSIIKNEIFTNNILDQYYVEWVIDDRNQVVEMWRNEIGLTCLQVADGDF